MKIEIGDNVQMLLGFTVVMAVIAFSIHEVKECNADQNGFEAGCVLSGGDPYQCCTAFQTPLNCSSKEK